MLVCQLSNFLSALCWGSSSESRQAAGWIWWGAAAGWWCGLGEGGGRWPAQQDNGQTSLQGRPPDTVLYTQTRRTCKYNEILSHNQVCMNECYSSSSPPVILCQQADLFASGTRAPIINSMKLVPVGLKFQSGSSLNTASPWPTAMLCCSLAREHPSWWSHLAISCFSQYSTGSICTIISVG